MENISCSLRIDSSTKTVDITGISTSNFIINYSDDVDFTPFVKMLTDKIDTEKLISITHEDLSEKTGKEKLVVETIKQIINSYNICIDEQTENQE